MNRPGRSTESSSWTCRPAAKSIGVSVSSSCKASPMARNSARTSSNDSSASSRPPAAGRTRSPTMCTTGFRVLQMWLRATSAQNPCLRRPARRYASKYRAPTRPAPPAPRDRTRWRTSSFHSSTSLGATSKLTSKRRRTRPNSPSRTRGSVKPDRGSAVLTTPRSARSRSCQYATSQGSAPCGCPPARASACTSSSSARATGALARCSRSSKAEAWRTVAIRCVNTMSA
mmetsp:Transcript_98925/g.302437  ORF Transcript_98925/g.302437 Transcript_98925/m.302437 type:complete len:229 (-) Transcript_98925:253-939(-)